MINISKYIKFKLGEIETGNLRMWYLVNPFGKDENSDKFSFAKPRFSFSTLTEDKIKENRWFYKTTICFFWLTINVKNQPLYDETAIKNKWDSVVSVPCSVVIGVHKKEHCKNSPEKILPLHGQNVFLCKECFDDVCQGRYGEQEKNIALLSLK